MFDELRSSSRSLLSPGGTTPPYPPTAGSRPRIPAAHSVPVGHLPRPWHLPGGRPPGPPAAGYASKPGLPGNRHSRAALAALPGSASGPRHGVQDGACPVGADGLGVAEAAGRRPDCDIRAVTHRPGLRCM
jgi:hypothetical protein